MTLADFWFFALAVVWAGFLVLEGFDFGVGMLHGIVGRDDEERGEAIGAIAPVWDGNEVWLIVAVAGTFAAFPGWYATMFSGFYHLFLVVLLALLLRGVAFEFRAHTTGLSRRLWEAALVGGSLVIPLAIGIVLGALLHGVPFGADQEVVGGPGYLLAPYPVVTGVTIVLTSLLLGALFLTLRTGGEVRRRAERAARLLGPPTAALVVAFVVWTRLGVAREVLFSAVELVAVLAAITAAVLTRAGRPGGAFVAGSVTVVAVTLSIFSELYPRVMVSSLGPAGDLTVAGTASSSYALVLMTVVLALFLPLVLAYQAWAYWVFRRRGSRGTPRGPDRVTPTDAVADGTGPGPVTARSGFRVDTETSTGRFPTWLLGWVTAFLLRRLRASAPADRARARGSAPSP
jgi:cytochrome d ubiquinol oxidase subunit II